MRRRWLLLAVVVVFVGGLAGLYAWMQSPVTNHGVSVVPEPSNVLGSQIQLVPFDTDYFSTSIPSFLQRKTATESDSAPVSGQYLFKHVQINIGDQLGITTGLLNGSSLPEVSGVKVRQSEPERYEQVARTNMPDGAIVFERKDQYETAIFWQENGRYASVVVSGGGERRAQLEEIVSSVINNWQWR